MGLINACSDPHTPYCNATLCTFRSKNLGAKKVTIMKKTYSNPTIDVVKIQSQLLLANSLLKDNDAVISSNDDVLGRDFDLDDEE